MILEDIQTREDLVVFIKQLEAEVRQKECNWENTSLDNYLEAMSAWIVDMDGVYKNFNLEMKDEPMWRIFARILRAATIYE